MPPRRQRRIPTPMHLESDWGVSRNAGRAKLTRISDEAVRDIRANCHTAADVKKFAAKYGIHRAAVYTIRRRARRWSVE